LGASFVGLSLLPEILEPGRRQLGVADGVRDVSLAEIGLQGACVVALVGQSIAAWACRSTVRVRTLKPSLAAAPARCWSAITRVRRKPAFLPKRRAIFGFCKVLTSRIAMLTLRVQRTTSVL